MRCPGRRLARTRAHSAYFWVDVVAASICGPGQLRRRVQGSLRGLRFDMDSDDAVAWIIDDAAEMAALLREAEPDQPVPACPGWSAADLSGHIARGFAAWYCYNISTRADEWTPAGLMERWAALVDDHETNIASFEAGVAQFVSLCSELDLDSPTWSFNGVEPAGWWIRRAGTELTVHLTDAAGIHGRRSSTTAQRHAEAIDEVTTEVFVRLPSIRAAMNAMMGSESPAPAPPERSAALVADDTGRAWTLTRGVDGVTHTIRGIDGVPAAVARASSADLLAWLHGRPMTERLSTDGDPALLDEWNLLQRTEF